MKISKNLAIAGMSLAGLFSATIAFGNHSWGGYHWERTVNPLELGLGNDLSSTWMSYFSTAVIDWNQSSVLSLLEVPGEAGNPKRCNAADGKVEICNDSYGNNGWLGIAGISVSGDHIQSGYVKLNDFYFDAPAYNSPAWRQMVTCQEIGHIFGLDHQDEDFKNANLGTCMDYTSDPSTNQHPNTHDYDELETIYGHLDGSSGSGGGGGGCFPPNSRACRGTASAADILSEIEMDGPAQWGRLVSSHGPVEVFELDFGGGRKVFTFVTWTLEYSRAHHH